MSTQTFENSLRDTCGLLREFALEARCRRDSVRGTPDEAFAQGYLMACHSIVSLLLQQAAAFQIPLETLQLAGVNPEVDLL